MSSTKNYHNRVTIIDIARNFYGHLGLQLHEFSLQNYTSIVRLLANITIAVVSVYGDVVLDCFSISDWHTYVERKKLFFGLLIKLVLNYGFGFSMTIRMIYYLFAGRRVARAVDCTYLRGTAARNLSTRANTILIITALGGINLYSYFIFLNYFFAFDNRKSPIIVIVECLAIYVNIVLAFFESNLLLYFQWICLRALTDIETDLRHKYLKLLNYESKAIEQIKTLASINRELYSSISFPLMVYMLINIAEFIIIVCFILVQFEPNNLALMSETLYSIVQTIYLVYIVNLNHQCRSRVLRIGNIFRDFANDHTRFCLNSQRYASSSLNFVKKNNYFEHHLFQKPLVGFNDTSYKTILSIPIRIQTKRKTATSMTRTNYFDEKQQHSRKIRAHEIDQYCDAFQLRIFHLTPLNFSTLFICMLSIFNIVIFIVQTN